MGFVETNNTKLTKDSGSASSAPRTSFYDYSFRSTDLIGSGGHHAAATMLGCVVEVNQQLQCYKIRVGESSDWLGLPLDSFGQSVTNRTISSQLYGVGSTVLILACNHLGPKSAVILGSIPSYLGHITSYGSPELVPSSPGGAYVDKISMLALNSEEYNFNGGRPIDVYPADTTILNSLGAGLFIGSMHATLRASTECAVECHYTDSLLRLTSFNYEQYSAGADVQFVADCGDYTEIKRSNPYVIESVGGTEQYGTFPKQAGTDRSTKPTPAAYIGKYALAEPEQVGWWRWLDLSGYLANVKLQFVLVPKLDKTRVGAETEAAQDEHAVFREHVDTSGAYSVVSAKSISFIKDCLIPAPKEQYRADDSRGDTNEAVLLNRAANAEYLKDADIKDLEAGQPHASMLYAAASSDMASFRTHRSLVMFRERKKDWSLKEIDEIDLAGFKSIVDSKGLLPASDGVSATRMYAALPKIGKLKVTAKEEVKYFASRSMIMLHEDGSIHIQDGYGSTISMRGGCIDLACPGDITLRPGRNLVGFAGDSAILIGGVDVELCGLKGDIRVQADRNVSVLAGNDGAGGILLETKAQFSPVTTPDSETFQAPASNANPYRGIWFKAAEAAVCTLAQQAYIGNNKENCKLVVDAGDSDITLRGTTANCLTKSVNFITNPTKPNSGTVFSINDSQGFQLSTAGSLYFRGSTFWAAAAKGDLNFYVKGNASFLGNVRMEGLSVLQGGGGGGLVPLITQETYNTYVATPLNEIFSVFEKNLNTTLVAHTAATAVLDESLVGKAESTLSNLTFCYPDSVLRGVPVDTQYVLFEADWQKAYREQGAGAQLAFRGVALKGKGADGITAAQSYCWPGFEALNNKFGALNSTSRFVTGTLAFKKDGFNEPIDLLEAPKSFENNYTIIRANKVSSITTE